MPRTSVARRSASRASGRARRKLSMAASAPAKSPAEKSVRMRSGSCASGVVRRRGRVAPERARRRRDGGRSRRRPSVPVADRRWACGGAAACWASRRSSWPSLPRRSADSGKPSMTPSLLERRRLRFASRTSPELHVGDAQPVVRVVEIHEVPRRAEVRPSPACVRSPSASFIFRTTSGQSFLWAAA